MNKILCGVAIILSITAVIISYYSDQKTQRTINIIKQMKNDTQPGGWGIAPSHTEKYVFVSDDRFKVRITLENEMVTRVIVVDTKTSEAVMLPPN